MAKRSPKKGKVSGQARPVLPADTIKKLAPQPSRTRGQIIPDDVRREFAAEFLRTGSVMAACRKADISYSAGYKFAEKLEQEDVFLEARKSLLARALERAATMVLAGAEIAYERGEREAVTDGNGNLVDNGAAYLRVVNDAHRSLLAQRKQESGNDGEGQSGPVEIVIRQHGTPASSGC